MRIRIWLLGGTVLASCLLLIVIWLASKREQPGLPWSQLAPTNRPPETKQPNGVGNYPLPNATKASAPMAAIGAPPAGTNATNGFFEQILPEWQKPIEFYGKVIDECSNPVAGANVTFGWSEFPTEEGARRATTKSDAEGFFSLHGKMGPSLDVWVSKDGYYASGRGQKGVSYLHGNFSPDQQNPVIFNLRKKGQGTELITSENGIRLNVSVRIPKDKTLVRVDLLEKKASATGQLEISQHKPPFREATEWSFRMSIPDGGFVANEDEFQFEAPETNYQPAVEYHFTKGGTNWTTQFVGKYYVAFGQPRKYGWLRIESNLSQETIFLTYAINPSGSRNLEPSETSPSGSKPPPE